MSKLEIIFSYISLSIVFKAIQLNRSPSVQVEKLSQNWALKTLEFRDYKKKKSQQGDPRDGQKDKIITCWKTSLTHVDSCSRHSQMSTYSLQYSFPFKFPTISNSLCLDVTLHIILNISHEEFTAFCFLFFYFKTCLYCV